MAVDTLLLCFCEDVRINDGSPEKPYFMDADLMVSHDTLLLTPPPQTELTRKKVPLIHTGAQKPKRQQQKHKQQPKTSGLFPLKKPYLIYEHKQCMPNSSNRRSRADMQGQCPLFRSSKSAAT